VAPGLRVIHAPTMSTRPIRLVGDIGVRAFWGCYRVLASLAAQHEIDFVLITIPSNFLAPVGRLIHRRYGMPFGIDYQDPWINRWPGIDVPFSRAWGSYRLASLLEPWVVRGASLITGMAPGYVAGVLERNPDIARSAVVACMPMGIAPEDYSLVRSLDRPPFLFQPGDGRFHMIYAGALLPAGIAVLESFLTGLSALKARAPDVASRLKVHFVGTGSSPDDPAGHQVQPRAQRMGVGDIVEEHPQRIGYVDALNHLGQSDAVLVLGSTEAHYTPSKVFQAMLSRRPVFAMLHREITAVDMVRSKRAGRVLTLTQEALPAASDVADGLQSFMDDKSYDADAIDRAAFDAYSARQSTRALAEALDLAYERAVARRG